MRTVFWLPKDSPDARPPLFGALAGQEVGTVGGIFYPIPAGQGTLCNMLPMATLWNALQGSVSGKKLELWIRLPTFNGSVNCGVGALTDLTRKAAQASLAAWKALIHHDLGQAIPICGVFMDVDGTYRNSLSIDGVRALVRSLGLLFGLLGDPGLLTSPHYADFYLARTYNVSLYNSGEGTFPLGSPTAFALCDRGAYCGACTSACSFSSTPGCTPCRVEQCSGRSGRSNQTRVGGMPSIASGPLFEMPAPANRGDTLTLDPAALAAHHEDTLVPVIPALPPGTPSFSLDLLDRRAIRPTNVWKPYELPAQVVPPSAPLAYKYGATIAMSRWFHDSGRKQGSGPIMACSSGSADCTIDNDGESPCNIGQAYAGFMDTMTKTGQSTLNLPVAFMN